MHMGVENGRCQMKKPIIFFMVILLVLTYLASNQNGQNIKKSELEPSNMTIPDLLEKVKDISEYSYVSEATIKNDSIIVMTYESRQWVRGNTIRSESTLETDRGLPIATHGFVHDKDNGEVLQYEITHDQNSSTSSGMTISLFAGEGESNLLFSTAGINPEHSKIIGQQRIGNRLCLVVENQGVIKVWIDARDYIPIRVENDEGELTVEYKVFKTGPGSVRDKDLEVPDDAQIVE